MAQGKFSQPRQPKRADGEMPTPKPETRPYQPDPIEDVSDEVAAFLRETEAEEAAYAPPAGWKEQTRVMPESWQAQTQVVKEDWRTDTRKVPEGWRDATQVVPPRTQQPQYTPPQPRQTPPVRNPYEQSSQYSRPGQPTEEWDFREPQPQQPRPVVRNHMVDNTPEDDYGYEDDPRDSGSRKMILISICVLVLVALLGTIFVVSKVFGGDKEEDDGLILANVMAAGIDLGGMTPNQAQVALYRATDDTYTVRSMIVTMPDGVIELKPRDTGARLNVEAVVDAAYHYGRKGTKAENEKAKENAQMGQVYTIALLPYLELDTDYIRDQLEDYGEYFNSTYEASSYSFKGTKPELDGDKFSENAPCETLIIQTGTPGRALDVDDVYDQVLDAYSFHEFEVTAEESAPEQIPEAIDLDRIFKEYCSTPIDAYMDMQTFEVVTETYGYTFDLEKAKVDLSNLEYGETLEIPMEYIVPEIMGDELEGMLFRDTLASYETKTTSDNNRNTNLKLACQAINGTLLNPGDSFSFNDCVGQRTEAAGYKKAGAFYNGESVTEVGGGICQVSSTLYACVLMADLDVTTRTAHSLPVSYVPMGMDATVSWGGPEFKFRNDTDYPLRIDAEVSGGYVKIKLIGTDERDYYVKIECKETATIEPEVKYEEFTWDNAEGYEDGDVIQEGVTGYTVKTYAYRYSKETNELIGESVEATSNYKSKEKIVAKVEPKPTEPPTEAPTEDSSQEDSGIMEDIWDIFGP